MWPGVVVVCSLVTVGVTARFPAPTLGEEIGRQAEARLGITLEASSSSFSLTRGIVLEGVTVRASSRNLILSADIGSLIATHELSFRWPLRIETIRLIEPVLTATVGERPDRSRRRPDSIPGPPARKRRRPREASDGAGSEGMQFGDVHGSHRPAAENGRLKHVVAELVLENRLLKISVTAADSEGDT